MAATESTRQGIGIFDGAQDADQNSIHTRKTMATETSPKKEISPDCSKEDTVMYLEQLATDVIEAINVRNYDSNKYPWTHLIKSFTVATGTGARPNATSLEETLKGHQKLAEANPAFEVRITSLHTTVHENISTAQVMMNATSTGTPGLPAGLWRNAVTILDFRYTDGKWMGVRECTMSGLGRMDEDWF